MKIRDQDDGTALLEVLGDKTLTLTMVDTAVLQWKHDDLTDRHQVNRLINALTLWTWKGTIQ